MIHRDLKLENVLFETKFRGRIKVVDFGISGLCQGNVREKNEAATLKYMTPEMLSQRDSFAGPAMDIWAIGVMTYCMLFNKVPFDGNSKEEIKDKIMNMPYKVPRYELITPECKLFLD